MSNLTDFIGGSGSSLAPSGAKYSIFDDRFVKFTSSQNITGLSGKWYCILSGGGGAGAGYHYSNGASGDVTGGGSGFIQTFEVTLDAASSNALVIGAGGIGADNVNGSKGGTSSFMGFSALGGDGGVKDGTTPSNGFKKGGVYTSTINIPAETFNKYGSIFTLYPKQIGGTPSLFSSLHAGGGGASILATGGNGTAGQQTNSIYGGNGVLGSGGGGCTNSYSYPGIGGNGGDGFLIMIKLGD